MTIAAAVTARAPVLAEIPAILAQTPQAHKPMGIDLSGPNALITEVFALMVGVIACVALYQAIIGKKPKLLLGLVGCVLLAGLIFRFTDVSKLRNSDIYTGVEEIGGIDGGGGPPTTR